MNNVEKKLDALIDALGFDVECVGDEECTCAKERNTPHVKCGCFECLGERAQSRLYKYILTYRRPAMVPIPVQSPEWSAIVEFVLNHQDDINLGISDFITLRPMLEFFNRSSND